MLKIFSILRHYMAISCSFFLDKKGTEKVKARNNRNHPAAELRL